MLNTSWLCCFVDIRGHFTFWISPSLSAVSGIAERTHRPQGVIILGIYMSSKYLLLVLS